MDNIGIDLWQCYAEIELYFGKLSNDTELETSIAHLKEQEQKLKEQVIQCTHELNVLEGRQRTEEKELESLEERLKSLKMDQRRLKDECKIAERRMQIGSPDKQILEKNRSKSKLYKNLTGLKWDYAAPLDKNVGYVFNNISGVRPFSFDDKSSNTEKIWSEVKVVASPDWESIE